LALIKAKIFLRRSGTIDASPRNVIFLGALLAHTNGKADLMGAYNPAQSIAKVVEVPPPIPRARLKQNDLNHQWRNLAHTLIVFDVCLQGLLSRRRALEEYHHRLTAAKIIILMKRSLAM
jgi:hypothetical protein